MEEMENPQHNRGLRLGWPLGRPSDTFYDFTQLGSSTTLAPTASNQDDQVVDNRRSPGPETTKENYPRTKPTKPQCSVWSFWLPLMMVTMPLLLIASWLLFVLCIYRVGKPSPILPARVPDGPDPNGAFILLDYSAERVLFISDLTSTIVPCLGGFIMTLWTWRIGLELLQTSENDDLSNLPNAQEYASLLSLTSASAESLLKYLWYTRKRKRQMKPGFRTPCVVSRSAGVLTMTFLFSIIIIVNDIALHYTTTTTTLDQARSPQVLGSHSLLLSLACLTLSRTENLVMPCSKNYLLWAEDADVYNSQQSEILNLSHNNSESVGTRVIPGASAEIPGIALVLPKSDKIPAHLDYRASSVGARTSCELITPQCDFELTGPYEDYWAFNCSNAFREVLGKAPPTPFEPQEEDLPPLMVKPTDGMQFAYFEDASLTTIYNSQGANLTDGTLPAYPIAMADNKLINPVYIGVAARFILGSQSPDADFSESPGFFNGSGAWYGFALSCSYETLEVQYTWSNGSILDVSSTRSPNGTLAEIYHGFHRPKDPEQLDFNLQDAMVQATMEDDTQRLLSKWSELLSIQIMSVIGAVLVPAPSIAEQVRSPMLAARVALPPVTLLIAFCLLYTILGCVVVTMAWTAIKEQTQDLFSLLSVERLAMYAFVDRTRSDFDLDGGESLVSRRGQRDSVRSTLLYRRKSWSGETIGVERHEGRFKFKI